jgi:hypothetical protein
MSCTTGARQCQEAIAPHVPIGMAVQPRCPACGQFTGAEGHVCPARGDGNGSGAARDGAGADAGSPFAMVTPVDPAWLADFQESGSFSREDARRLLEEVRESRVRALAGRTFAGEAQARRAARALDEDLRRTARAMALASQVAQGESLDAAQYAIAVQATGYHNLVVDGPPALHALRSAEEAGRLLEEKGRGREEVAGVYQAIKQHNGPAMNEELPRYVGRLAFEGGDYRPALRELLLDALDRSEDEYREVAEFVEQTRPYVDRAFGDEDPQAPLRELCGVLGRPESDCGELAEFVGQARANGLDLRHELLKFLLHGRFGETVLTFPRPSTKAAQVVQDAIALAGAHVRRLCEGWWPRLESIGTPGGKDVDLNVFGLSWLCERKRIVFNVGDRLQQVGDKVGLGRALRSAGERLGISGYELEVFIDSGPRAEAATVARLAMDSLLLDNPGLYQKWLTAKAVAQRYVDEGVLAKEDYILVKAEFHAVRGMPDAHYRWKAADAERIGRWPPDLRAALYDGVGRMSVGHQQAVYALHDAEVLEYLDPRNLHSWIEAWEGRSVAGGLALLHENVKEKALRALHTETAREIARQNLELLEEFRGRYTAAVQQAGREPPPGVAHRMLDHFLAQRWKRL